MATRDHDAREAEAFKAAPTAKRASMRKIIKTPSATSCRAGSDREAGDHR